MQAAQTAPARVKTKWTRKRKDNLLGWSLACIPVVGFVIFTLFPMVLSVYMSFNTFAIDSYSFSAMTWVGIDNYAFLFRDPDIYKALYQTFLFCLSIPFEIVIGLLIANLLRKKFFGRGAFRVILFLPNICSIVAIAYVWRYIYSPADYGLLNQLLAAFGAQPFAWINNANAFIPCLIVMTIWNVVGYDILLFQAALGNINQSLYEAAELDGAGSVSQFFNVTVPLSTPTAFYLLLMGLIGGLQSYARMDSMNINDYGFGPENSGLTLVAYIMRSKNSVTYGGLGVSSAASLFTAVIISLFTLLNLKISKRWVHYND